MIIGLCGNGRVGKDTVAEHLVFDHAFNRVGLADPLKRFCQEVFDFSPPQLWGDERDVEDRRYPRLFRWQAVEDREETIRVACDWLTPRFALQTLGTEWGRHCYNNVWIDYGLNVARKIETGCWDYSAERGLWSRHEASPPLHPAGVVFSDLRFKNEIDAVCAAGGKLIRIRRPGFDGSTLNGVAGHASEIEQAEIPDAAFDAVIVNDSTIPDLTAKVDALLASWRPA